MAIIKATGGTAEATVYTNSNAIGVVLFATNNLQVYEAPVGSYILPIGTGRITTAVVASAALFTMKNGGPRTVRIKRMSLNGMYDSGAAASVQISGVVVCRMSTTTATPSGGSALTVIKKKTSYVASNVSDARTASVALTVTNQSYEAPFICISTPQTVGSDTDSIYAGGTGADFNLLELASTEGLCIRVNSTTALATGYSICGFIEWDEV